MKQGLFVILTGCTGAGKKTVRRILVRDNPSLCFIPPYTTRPPKKKEKPGKDAIFLRQEEFRKRKEEGLFLYTYEEGNYSFGIEKEKTLAALKEGKTLVIDVPHPAAKELMQLYSGRYTRTIDVVIPTDDLVEKRVKRGLHGLSPYQTHKAVRDAIKDNNDKDDYDVLLNNYDLKRTVKRCSQSIDGRLSYIQAYESGNELPKDYVIKRP